MLSETDLFKGSAPGAIEDTAAATTAQLAPTVEVPVTGAEVSLAETPGRLRSFYNRQVARLERHKKAVVALGLVGALAVTGAVAQPWKHKGSIFNTVSADAAGLPANVTHNANCDTADIEQSSFPDSLTRIIPAYGTVSSPDQAAKQNQQLFSTGNLGESIDPVAEATVYSLIGYQATNPVVDNTSTIKTIFNDAMSKMGTGEKPSTKAELKAAANFCDVNESVTKETVSYDATAIAAGTQFTQISGVPGPGGYNEGIAMKNVTLTHNVSGITYQVQNANTATSYNGFDEVVVPVNAQGQVEGVFDVVGLKPNSGNSTKGSNGTSTTVETTPSNVTPDTSGSGGGSSPTEHNAPYGGAGSVVEGSQTGQSGTGTGGPGGNGGGNTITRGGGSSPTSTEASPTTTPNTVVTTTTVPYVTTTTTTRPVPVKDPVTTTTLSGGGSGIGYGS